MASLRHILFAALVRLLGEETSTPVAEDRSTGRILPRGKLHVKFDEGRWIEFKAVEQEFGN